MNTAATRAAIRRASQQARNAMQVLDREGLDALQAMYGDAADAVRSAIRSKVDSSDMVPLYQLRDLLRQIEDVTTELGAKRDALLQQGLNDAAALGVRPYTMQGVAAVGSTGVAQAVLTSAAAMSINQEAVQFVQSFTAADGLTLSDRLWRLDQGAKEVLGRAIGQAVVSGWDASKAAAQFMYGGQALPGDIAVRLKGAKLDGLLRQADLLTGAGGEVWKADRVFRTEINRAHGTAYMSAATKTPGFAGFKFLLSPRHPQHDICDLLASQNLYGLGPGVYPSADKCPWPAHPNTLSFVVMVFADEVTPADKAGKETTGQAMNRMEPGMREAILGVGKSEIFNDGKLKPWMIRSPLAAVKARLARTGGG